MRMLHVTRATTTSTLAPSRRTRNRASAAQARVSASEKSSPIVANPPPNPVENVANPTSNPSSQFLSQIVAAVQNCSAEDLQGLRDSLVELIDNIDACATYHKIPIHRNCVAACTAAFPPIQTRPSLDAGVQVCPPSPPRPTYASVACATLPEPTPAPLLEPSSKLRARPSPKSKPALNSCGSAVAQPPVKQVRKPVRLVVHLSGKDQHRGRFSNNTYWYRLLAESFRRHHTGISLLGMGLNRRGNLLLSFPDTTPRRSLMDRLNIIRGTLGLKDDVRISFDTPWSTIHLANIPARPDPESPVFSEAELFDSLHLNTAIKDLAITSKPRWIRKPENITGARTSAVLSFEDPDGSIARQLLKTPIFAFGAPVTVKPWLTKPANSVRRSTPPRPPSSMDVI